MAAAPVQIRALVSGRRNASCFYFINNLTVDALRSAVFLCFERRAEWEKSFQMKF